MEHGNLISEIINSLNNGKINSYSIEIPPGCGASWFAKSLFERLNNNQYNKSKKKYNICFFSGDSFDFYRNPEHSDWKFVRRLGREWDVLNKINNSENPNIKYINEDKDATGLLDEIIKNINNSNEYPILIVDRFEKLAKELDSVFCTMRDLEQLNQMSSIMISPVTLSTLKGNSQSERANFVTSDYGDTHLTRRILGMSENDIIVIASKKGVEKNLKEISTVITEVLGNRAVSYEFGFGQWLEILQVNPEDSFSKKINIFKEILESESYKLFRRFLKWLKIQNSLLLIKNIKLLFENKDNQIAFKFLENHPWVDLILDEKKKKIICSGLGNACKKIDIVNKEDIVYKDIKLHNITRVLKYRGKYINKIKIKQWLNQFPINIHEDLLILLETLTKNYYFDEDRQIKYLRRLFEKAIESFTQNGIFKNMGTKGIQKRLKIVKTQKDHKSESKYIYDFFLYNNLPRCKSTEPIHLTDALEFWKLKSNSEKPILLCIDDFIGSGKTGVENLINNFYKAFGKDKNKWPNQTILIYLSISGFDIGKELIEKELNSCVNIIIGKELKEKDRVFSDSNKIISDPKKKKIFKKYF